MKELENLQSASLTLYKLPPSSQKFDMNIVSGTQITAYSSPVTMIEPKS